MDLREFKKELDREIQNFLDKKLKPFQRLDDKDIQNHLYYLKTLFLEGKRVRPYLAFISYKSVGGEDDKKVIKLFVFLELFHVFCLIHDDIMDEADQRHGIKTIHKYISDKYKNNPYLDPDHFGSSNAILIGDFLFSWANEVLVTNKGFGKESIKRVYQEYKQMINDVFLGQLVDLTITAKNKVSDAKIMQKYYLKTAKYSFIKPLIIGALLKKEKIEYNFYEDFGKHLGISYQIQDDLLDIKYDEKLTNKSSFNDIEQHQHTLFTNYVFNNGTSGQIKALNLLFGNKLSKKDKHKLRKIFYDSGAIRHGEGIINDNLTKAKKVLIKQKMEKEYKNLLFDLVNMIEGRKK